MIKFQTRFTKLLIGENISLAKKGKNPLRVIFELREDFKEFGYWENGYSASYRPSIHEFSVTADFGTGELERKIVQ